MAGRELPKWLSSVCLMAQAAESSIGQRRFGGMADKGSYRSYQGITAAGLPRLM
jgi:hypothetical protein